MGQLVFGAITPHPPIIIEEIGGGERLKAQDTIEGLRELALDVLDSQPETLIIISPHGPVFEDGIVILGEQELTGNFGDFGAPQVKLTFQTNLKLAETIVDKAKAQNIFAVVAGKSEAGRLGIRQFVDHGAAVPLTFFKEAGFNGRIILMGMALFPPDELYEFGMAMQEAIEECADRVVIIASGDLSHRLTPEANAGYTPKGAEFDRTLVERLRVGDFAGVMDIDPELIEAAGECGYRPINILLGAFDGYRLQTKIYSYQGPWGVGYLVGGIKPLDKSAESGQFINDYRARRQKRIAELTEKRHPIVQLAAASLEHYLAHNEYLKEFAPLPGDLPKRAGVFVSLKRHGNLRGCIGTIEPTQVDLAQEVITNAISAGTQDPRFFPLDLKELTECTISVDVLGEPERISGPEQLDPTRYGVIVQRGNRSGLLLPNLEGIDSAAEQVRIARQKAGISLHEDIQLSRFEVQRFY